MRTIVIYLILFALTLKCDAQYKYDYKNRMDTVFPLSKLDFTKDTFIVVYELDSAIMDSYNQVISKKKSYFLINNQNALLNNKLELNYVGQYDCGVCNYVKIYNNDSLVSRSIFEPGKYLTFGSLSNYFIESEKHTYECIGYETYKNFSNQNKNQYCYLEDNLNESIKYIQEFYLIFNDSLRLSYRLATGDGNKRLKEEFMNIYPNLSETDFKIGYDYSCPIISPEYKVTVYLKKLTDKIDSKKLTSLPLINNVWLEGIEERKYIMGCYKIKN